jgi:hypothetical protein
MDGAIAAGRMGAVAFATIFAFAIGICVGAQAVSARQASPYRQALQQACMADYQALCADTFPGGGRIAACLQANAAKLSPDCRNALQNAKAARQTPQGE